MADDAPGFKSLTEFARAAQNGGPGDQRLGAASESPTLTEGELAMMKDVAEALEATCHDCGHLWTDHEGRGCTAWPRDSGPCTCRRTPPREGDGGE